jgi:hypothetical protein
MRTLLRVCAVFVLLALTANASHAQATDSLLSYYNQDSTYRFYPLPAPFGVTSGTDTARLIVGYGERFSAPWPVTYLDSVWVLMRIDKLDGAAVIPIEARKAIQLGGHWYPDPVSAPLGHDAIGGSEAMLGQPQQYSANYLAQPQVDGTFFVTISAVDPANTQASLLAGSVTEATKRESIVEDTDRAQFYLNAPYQGLQAYYLAGTQWSNLPGVYDYSNFIIFAHVSSVLGSVADIYPADQDPLTFFVERTRDGESILHYTLRDASLTTLRLYDTRGVLVTTLFDDREVAGAHDLHIPQIALPAGMYYAQLSANGASEVRPVAIVR